MKLTIIGGGGFRTPLIYQALAGNEGDHALITEIALYDTDRARLTAIGAVLEAMPSVRTSVVLHTELDTALADADFVFCSVRVGGTRGRTLDERVALDCGVLGQETAGAGGLAYGLRGVPVLTSIAHRIAERAPRAWVINFTNPVGMITEAMSAVLGDRVIGICDSPAGLFRRVAWLLGVSVTDASFDYAGLNHLGWLRAVRTSGGDRLPELLAEEGRLSLIEEGRLFGEPLLRRLGMIPNEYLYYYYFTREAIEAAAAGPTRGEFLHRQQEAFYAEAERAPHEALRRWQEVRAEREATYSRHGESATGEPAGGGYEFVALAVIRALAGRAPTAQAIVVNVRNRGTLPGVPDDAVVEVPCRIDAGGARPVTGGPLPAGALDLVAAVKKAERTAIAAASARSRELAETAFAVHPLVRDRDVAGRLLDGYLTAHEELRELR